jgi:DNA uptake protein ComE-like DNA-binding protein
MEGGLTRQRAYLWLTAALLVVLLIVLITCRKSPSSPSPMPSEISQQSDTMVSDKRVQLSSRTKHHTARKKTTTIVAECPPATIYHKEKQLLFNLNTADSLDLVQLYNIGPTFARRIIRYRTLLGGFVDKSQLWEVKGMDSIRYNDIAPHLYADPADITQIDLNHVTLDQLKRHPYLDYYQAKAIVQLRDATGLYHNIEDILKIPIIDNETYTHIAPYLTCNSQPNK